MPPLGGQYTRGMKGVAVSFSAAHHSAANGRSQAAFLFLGGMPWTFSRCPTSGDGADIRVAARQCGRHAVLSAAGLA